ncbi:HNH endonuclease, partial [Salmonella enterica]|nr:HNH endonuclease [Salmonella enterica]
MKYEWLIKMIENLSHNYLHELKNRFLAKVD